MRSRCARMISAAESCWPFSIFQTMSGLICARSRGNKSPRTSANSRARSVWKLSIAPEKSGASSSTAQPISVNARVAARQSSATSGSMLRRPRLVLNPMRSGGRARFRTPWKPPGAVGRDSGSWVVNRVMASSISARSGTLRAIGPSTHRLSKAGNPSPRGTTPGLGRIPTMPQKLAGMRNDPPKQEPLASQTSPAASAAAAPPEEPPAVHSTFQGLRVTPHTGLNV